GLGWNKLIPLSFQVSIAAIAMGMVVQFLKYPLAKVLDQQYFWGIFGQGLIAGMAGLVVYGGLCYILKVPELMRTKESLQKRWLRPQNISTTEVVELKD
ncbi:MAG: hypothetical protein Q7S24_01010, partial [bacterium]|nr:hypothetical protein [bacterium]